MTVEQQQPVKSSSTTAELETQVEFVYIVGKHCLSNNPSPRSGADYLDQMARDPITVGDRGFTNRKTMARKLYLNASRRNSQFVKVAGDNGLQYHQHGEIEAEHSRLQKTNTASVPELHRDNSAPCLCE